MKPTLLALFLAASLWGQTAPSGTAFTISYQSNGSTAFLLQKAVTVSGVSRATDATTADTIDLIGVAQNTAVAGQAVALGTYGPYTCTFDGATTAGDYVQASTTVAGNCHDVGATRPTTNGQIVGRVTSTNASGGNYTVSLYGTNVIGEAGGGGVPAGLITFVVSGACPTGWTEVAALNGVALRGTLAANGDVGTATGADSATPTVASTNLTAAAQTFTGSSATSSAVSAGTPAGTNAWPAGVPTNASGAFAEGAISWPAGVPTNANESAHTHSVTAAGTNGTAAFTPAGTNSACATVKFTTSGSGTAACSPAFTPTFTGSAGTVPAQTFTGSAVTSGAGSAHTHTISWPAGVPTIAAGVFTQPTISWPAGVPTFSGSALGTHSHTVTATGTNGASAVSGTITMNSVATVPSSIRVIFCSKN